MRVGARQTTAKIRHRALIWSAFRRQRTRRSGMHIHARLVPNASAFFKFCTSSTETVRVAGARGAAVNSPSCEDRRRMRVS